MNSISIFDFGEFEESQHPRGGKGTKEGGKFVKKGTGGTPISPAQKPASAQLAGAKPVGPAGAQPANSFQALKAKAKKLGGEWKLPVDELRQYGDHFIAESLKKYAPGVSPDLKEKFLSIYKKTMDDLPQMPVPIHNMFTDFFRYTMMGREGIENAIKNQKEMDDFSPEKKALDRWTQRMDWVKKAQAMDRGEEPKDEHYTNLMKVLDNSPRFSGTVYRGLSQQISVEKGQVITLNNLQSGSKDPAVAQRFAQMKFDEAGMPQTDSPSDTPGTILVMKNINDARDISELPGNDDKGGNPFGQRAHEVILMKGTSAKVESVEKRGHLTIVTASYAGEGGKGVESKPAKAAPAKSEPKPEKTEQKKTKLLTGNPKAPPLKEDVDKLIDDLGSDNSPLAGDSDLVDEYMEIYEKYESLEKPNSSQLADFSKKLYALKAKATKKFVDK